MGRQTKQTNRSGSVRIIPQSNKAYPRQKIVRDQLSSITSPAVGSIVDPSLNTTTGPLEESREKTINIRS